MNEREVNDPRAIPVPLVDAGAMQDSSPPHSAPKGWTTINIEPTMEYYAGFIAKEERQLRIHPVCDCFPMIAKSSISALAQDIQTNGLIHPIVIFDRQIVDGRSRLLACRAAKVEPRFVKWRDHYKGPMTLGGWAWSVNGERLSPDMATAVRKALNDWERIESYRQRRAEARRMQGKPGK